MGSLPGWNGKEGLSAYPLLHSPAPVLLTTVLWCSTTGQATLPFPSACTSPPVVSSCFPDIPSQRPQSGLILPCSLCLCVLSHSVCPTLCNPVDCSLPGSSVHGILQARILEWVAMPSCRGSSNPGIEPRSPALKAYILPSKPLGSPGILGWEDPLGSPRILEWVNYPFSRDRPFFLTDPGIELGSPALQADSLPSEPPWKPLCITLTL